MNTLPPAYLDDMRRDAGARQILFLTDYAHWLQAPIAGIGA